MAVVSLLRVMLRVLPFTYYFPATPAYCPKFILHMKSISISFGHFGGTVGGIFPVSFITFPCFILQGQLSLHGLCQWVLGSISWQ